MTCGTEMGYKHHRRTSTEPCADCLDAHRLKTQRWRDSLDRGAVEMLAATAIAAMPGPWIADASCAQADGEAWFPQVGGSTTLAKRICADCPVRNECLQFALDTDQTDGIWGGMVPRDRARLKKKRAA